MSTQTESALQKEKKSAEAGLANAPMKKKIGFFSAMMVAVGSCVGSGIFFKAGAVLDNAQGSIIFAMFCWIFAAFGVICMALALIEIASARNDNLSMIGWNKTFNSRIIYKACKNFMFYIYLPLNYFVMPLYVIMAFQDGVASIYAQMGKPYDGFGTGADWAIMMAITIGISVYFIFVCGMSAKAGNIQNWIITGFKFIPLVFAAVIGFVIIGMQGSISGPYDAGFVWEPSNNAADIYSFSSMSPGFGLFIAAGAIFFAYDGFYAAAGLQSEMKEPKKTPIAILLGLIVVTVIYLIIAISMSLGSQGGNPQGLVFFFAKHNVLPIFATFQILIAIGILGVINGFALWAPRFTEDLIREGELPYSEKAAAYMKGKNIPWVGIIYNLIISLPIIVIFCIIGGVGYIDTYGNQTLATVGEMKNVLGNSFDWNAFVNAGLIADDKGNIINSTEAPAAANGNGVQDSYVVLYNYGTGMGSLYAFCDVMANWTALFAFLFIVLAIYGGLRNRSKEFVKVEKSKVFVPFAILTIVTMALPIFFTIFEPIANLFFLFWIPTNTDGFSEIVTGRIMIVVVLFLYFALMFGPIVIEDMMNKKKYGSVEKAELEKINNIRAILGEEAVESVAQADAEEATGADENNAEPVLVAANPVEEVEVVASVEEQPKKTRKSSSRTKKINDVETASIEIEEIKEEK